MGVRDKARTKCACKRAGKDKVRLYEIRQGQSTCVRDQAARTKCACMRSGKDKVRVYEVKQGQSARV